MSVWGTVDPQIFAYENVCIYTHNATIHGVSDRDQKRLQTRRPAPGCVFGGKDDIPPNFGSQNSQELKF